MSKEMEMSEEYKAKYDELVEHAHQLVFHVDFYGCLGFPFLLSLVLRYSCLIQDAH